MNDVSIQIPTGDMQKLFQQIARAQKELNKPIGQAVRFAAWSVAQSLGVATNVAKKYRPYRAVEQAKKGKQKVFRITSHKKGNAKKFTVRAKSVADLKKMPQVRIGMAGLAKSSWYWGIRKIGGGRNIGTGGATAVAKRRGDSAAIVEKRLVGDDPYVKITNKLPYIRDAFKGGQSAIAQAMEKASRNMARIIDANVAKKMGLK